jgi:hypothetical protein
VSLLCFLSAQIDRFICCEVRKQERDRGFDHSTGSNRYREAAVVNGAREREIDSERTCEIIRGALSEALFRLRIYDLSFLSELFSRGMGERRKLMKEKP